MPLNVHSNPKTRLAGYVGQTINGLEVLKLLPRNASGDFKYWLRCSCGQEFSAGLYNVIRGIRKVAVARNAVDHLT